ncbi:MAG: transcription termination factor NusA, partial [SAR324 cluster bacterium]|nr:transcription termination factor NusA [SAR324 cluster bacterium]
MKENLLEIINDVSKEKGLDKEVLIQLVEESIVHAVKRKLPYEAVEGRIHPKTGQIEMFHYKVVVEFVEDAYNEISLEEVRKMDPDAILDDEVEYEISPKEFSRIAHSARQIIFSSIREAEREMVVNTFEKKVGEIITGNVLRAETNGRISINFMNRTEAYLFRREQIQGEQFGFGDHIRVFLLDVNNNPQKASQLTISRTHPGLLVKMFEMEVPEIFDGIVKIVHAAREPGKRAKISVYSTDDEVDPVGACVGMRGSRVQTIVNELHGEKIDIVRYSEEIETYACNALAPAEIESMEIDEENKEIDVVVATNQLSLAIGRQGQNVRLASKLIGYKINVTADEDEEQLSIEEQLELELEKNRKRAEAEELQNEETSEGQEQEEANQDSESEISEPAAVAEETQTSDETGPSADKSESEADSGTAQDDPEPLAQEVQTDNESSELGASVAETEDNSGSEEEPEKAEK